jgi:hypothetical protein
MFDATKIDQAISKTKAASPEAVAPLYREASVVFDQGQSRAYVRVFPKSELIACVEDAFIFDQLVEDYMEIEAAENLKTGDKSFNHGFYASLQGEKVPVISGSSGGEFDPYIGDLDNYRAAAAEDLVKLVKMRLYPEGLEYSYKGKALTDLSVDDATQAVLFEDDWDDAGIILEFEDDFMILHWYTLA